MDTRPWEVWSLLLPAFVFLLTSVKGEIRCYCNLGPCVSTGYMCKSMSFCFSDLETGLHGCAERRGCVGAQCCKEDMCNYMHVDVNVRTHKAAITDPVETEPLPDDSSHVTLVDSAMRREIWFKAAVIATPIGGICVLVLLVAFAAKMLRQDAARQRRRLPEFSRIYGHSFRHTLLAWNGKVKNTTIV